jgi:hypothetical protein
MFYAVNKLEKKCVFFNNIHGSLRKQIFFVFTNSYLWHESRRRGEIYRFLDYNITSFQNKEAVLLMSWVPHV